MILVFKTNVNTKAKVKKIKPFFDKNLTNAKWNFDLTDCDKILRIECNENISILARSPRDENDGFPLPSQTRVTQKRKKVIQEELFPDARNFR